jgi:hypothetical protein
MNVIEDQVLLIGGNINWFTDEGLDEVPERVRALGEANTVLAH